MSIQLQRAGSRARSPGLQDTACPAGQMTLGCSQSLTRLAPSTSQAKVESPAVP